MRICYFDAFSGISGDMTVGSLLDAGADIGSLSDALGSLGLGASYRAEKTKRRGIAATKFHVDGGETKAHRHLHHIDTMITGSALPDAVKQNSLAVFRRLAEAEAKVHGTTIEKVHFHEVGAVDSISDIAGACFCLNQLGVERVYGSAVNVGSGTVNTEHGVLPVPAPATADLLRDTPVYARGPDVELTTPTGAALLTTLAARIGSIPAMRIAATGFGAGNKDFKEHANVLRVIVGDTTEAAESMSVSVIEANIDDSTPEVIGYAMGRLLEAGALDVTLTPVQMKKSRPGVMLSVVARPEQQEDLARILFLETSTIGLRIHGAERRVQARKIVDVQTTHGRIRIKVSEMGSFAPEYEDCRRIAAERGVPLKQIVADAGFAYLQSLRG
jgi:pyridinium-3,5-bisthiocarboxylic acid mononucleotide nickel chelatase